MPLFRALAKNMAASYFGESALRFCNGRYTSVCLYSVTIYYTITGSPPPYISYPVYKPIKKHLRFAVYQKSMALAGTLLLFPSRNAGSC